MLRKSSINFLVLTIFCLLSASISIFGQSTLTGGLRGKVTDPQDAVVANAAVTVTNTGTNKVTNVTANEDGVYVANNLQPGTYTVVATSTGFANTTKQGIIVEVGQTTTIDFALSITQQAIVEVTSEAPVINTNDNSNTTNINQTSINELPINGRRASNFALLAPSTVPDGTFGLISFRGISGLLNNSTVDGGDNNQAFFSEERGRTRINYSISQSAVREFQINGSNYSAEYGRAAGGVVNTVTKSGTNQFHGDLFYYNRNNRNGARNPLAFRSVLDASGVSTLAPAKPIDLRQQFGGTIGGPIIKNKLFFFFSYDQQKRNFPGLAVFTTPGYLNTVSRSTLTARGLTDTQINNSLSFLNSLTGETPRRGDQKLFLPKLDWQINKNNLFSATYNRLRWFSPAGVQTQAVNNLGRSSFGDDGVKVDTLNARLQSTISSNLLNEARFQYSRDFEFQFSTNPLPGEPLTGSTALGVRSPNIFLTNGIQFGIPNFLERPAYPDERRTQFADTVTFISGRHTFKFGGDFNHVKDITSNLRLESGGYTYSNINDFIVDYVNYVTPLSAATVCATSTRVVGRCYTSNYTQGIGTKGLTVTTNEYNVFAQDDFRINPRLTVNLGVRYEYISLPKATLANTSTALIPNVGRTLAEATSTMPKDKNNFGPRFGFAYDVFGDGKTSLRGGYGIYYGRIQNSTIYNALINTGNPGGQSQLSIPTTITVNNVTTVNPCAPVFPFTLASLPASCSSFQNGAIQYFQKNFQAPLINQYDLVLERQIAKNTVASISYIGSLGRNLPTFVDYNFAPTGTSATYTIVGGDSNGQTFSLPTYARANTAFAQLTQIESTVKSQYDALVLQVNRRFTSGLQFQASYTLAKSTDTNQNSATFTQNNSPYNVFDRSYDAGPSSFDVRHKIVVSAVYAPEFFKGSKKSAYNYLLNGWSVAPIYTYYSGRPFDGVVSGTTLNGTNGDTRFPLNPRNAYRLPNLWNLDLRLSKRFKITESTNLELLAEGFNVFNRTQVFGENNTLYSRTTNCFAINGITTNNANSLCANPPFGSVTTTDSTLYRERQIQFAARFQF